MLVLTDTVQRGRGMAKKCMECPYFHIAYPPVKGVDFGKAECRKHDLVTEWVTRHKLKKLVCVEEGE